MSTDNFFLLSAVTMTNSIIGRIRFLEFVARLESIVCGIVTKVTVVVGALPILEALQMNLPRLLPLGVVDSFASFGNVVVAFELVHHVELQSPNDIGGVFNVPRFLETLEGNELRVVRPIETADDYKGRIGIALKFFKLANRIINAELG